ncbi:lipid II flippase MurJ [Shewanella khirikhana]|uniref:Peptidoglycan biosynthesis protein MurJ n=1 Tax=Shewanella khirikhana TaxID=1965282 RepID=A0ABN5TV51_9GAMM|nr:lipid II flippase MurJ [Shewanella khirikhana]AZQ11103.1 putative peptidoglycan biosynthesis protein MurJ [Shewanella khirikhana]
MNKVLLAGLSVSFALFLGRVTGFLRDVIVASSFGISLDADMIILLLTIPDIVVNILVGGAIGLVLIPRFKAHNYVDRSALYIQALLISFVVFLAISFSLSFFSTSLLSLLSPGIVDMVSADFLWSLSVVLYSVPLIVMSGVTTAFLNSNDKFFVAALGTLIFNVVVIFFITFYFKFNLDSSVFNYVSISVIVAVTVRFLFLFYYSGLNNFQPSAVFRTDLVDKELARQYIFCVLGCVATLSFPILVRAYISLDGEGYLAISNFAMKLVDLPLGVVLTVFSIVFFPKLSETLEPRHFSRTFTNVACIIIVISIVITLVSYNCSTYIVELVYGRGSFTQDDINTVANFFKVFSLSLGLQGLISFIVAAFAAKADNSTPLWILAINISICIVSIHLLGLSSIDALIAMNIGFLSITISLLVVLNVKHQVRFFHLGDGNLVQLSTASITSVLYHLVFSYLDSSFFWISTFTLIYISLNLIPLYQYGVPGLSKRLVRE